MANIFGDFLQHARNLFSNRSPTIERGPYNFISTRRPDTLRTYFIDKNIVNVVYNKIAVSCASVSIRHVRINENSQFIDYIHSGLDNILTTEANIDQSGRDFIQDIVLSMFDEGVVAVVPIETHVNLTTSSTIDIRTARVGKILQWAPRHVQVRLYNELTGQKEDLILPKNQVAIIENPFYSVMNAPNSTAQRLTQALNLADSLDQKQYSNKLDLIIQLPYAIRNEKRREEAQKRLSDIELQMTNSQYGVAYIDAAEKITQLNRPVENQLLGRIEYLTNQLYVKLGISEDILKGTADEKTMLNFFNDVIEPVLSVICAEFKRKFLSKTARTQMQSINYYRNPFKLASVEKLSEVADKFTRNEILTSNEVRGIIGFKPSDQPSANELRNKNLNQKIPTGQNDTYYDQEFKENKEEFE